MDYFTELFIQTHSIWQQLAMLYGHGISPEEAYTAYLENWALDEHHFSPEVRAVARINKSIADQFLALPYIDKATVTRALGG